MITITYNSCVESLTVYFLAVLFNNNDEDHYCLGTNMAWDNHRIMMLMIYLSRKSKIITILVFVVFFLSVRIFLFK